jgi:GTP-binding protein YchF
LYTTIVWLLKQDPSSIFADPDVTHVDGDVSPERDIETVVTELMLADLQTLEKAMPRLAKETKFAKDPERARVAAAAEAAQRLLDSGTPLSSGAAAAGIDVRDLRELQLLTAKPFLYVFNLDTSELADEDLRKRLPALVAPAEAIFLDAKTEADLAELPEDEAAELLAEAGLGEPGLAQLARAGFRALGLATFLTAGPKETRAWEIKAGATAPEAAGVIHTDFQRGFIKAEVVSYDDLIAAGSLPAARAAGKARIEGKDYVMRDGDVSNSATVKRHRFTKLSCRLMVNRPSTDSCGHRLCATYRLSRVKTAGACAMRSASSLAGSPAPRSGCASSKGRKGGTHPGSRRISARPSSKCPRAGTS